MDNENVIVLTDEGRNEVRFEFLDLIPYRGKEYVVLLPTSDDADEVVILQLEETDDETESYTSVEKISPGTVISKLTVCAMAGTVLPTIHKDAVNPQRILLILSINQN